jgi:hypothetical protein
MNNTFNENFQELKSHKRNLLSAPFNIDVDNMPDKFQVELPELQGNDTPQHMSHESSLLHVYKPLPCDEFAQSMEFAKKVVCLVAPACVSNYFPERVY